MFIEEVRQNSLTRFAQEDAFEMLQERQMGDDETVSKMRRHTVSKLQKRHSFLEKAVHITLDDEDDAATRAGNTHNSYLPSNLLELMNLKNVHAKLESKSREHVTKIQMLTQEVETAENLIKKMQMDKDFVELKYAKQR